jgi:hypothetical protein
MSPSYHLHLESHLPSADGSIYSCFALLVDNTHRPLPGTSTMRAGPPLASCATHCTICLSITCRLPASVPACTLHYMTRHDTTPHHATGTSTMRAGQTLASCARHWRMWPPGCWCSYTAAPAPAQSCACMRGGNSRAWGAVYCCPSRWVDACITWVPTQAFVQCVYSGKYMCDPVQRGESLYCFPSK